MKIAINRAHAAILLIFAIGILQYAPTMLESIRQENISLFSADDFQLESAGAVRYAKDATNIFLIILSLTALNHRHTLFSDARRLRLNAVIWIVLFSSIGLVGYLAYNTPIFILLAGIRWVALLGASFAIFLFCIYGPGDRREQIQLLRLLFVLALADAAAVTYQFMFAARTLSVGLGASRVTGLFSNAGVGAFFALSIAMVACTLQYTKTRWRLLLLMLCVWIALTSGTRFVMISVAGLMLATTWEKLVSTQNRSRGLYLLALAPFVAILTWGAFNAMIQTVDRGDIFSAQLESGGRINNFYEIIMVFMSADSLELLFGRGLGVGTNTAFSMASSRGIAPESIRFNWLIDNAFLTGAFQFGLIGSLIFWFGIYCVWRLPAKGVPSAIPYKVCAAIFCLNVLAGNPFEQFFLSTCYAYVIGTTYWAGKKDSRCL